MKKLFLAASALAMLLPATANAQQTRDQQTREKPATQSQQPASRPTAHPSSQPQKQQDKQASAKSKTLSSHPFTKGSRFSRAKAPNYRRVSYRENKRLSAPAPGYVWVRAGHDALLVKLSTNIVVRIVADVF